MKRMEIPVEKNKEYIVKIIDNGFEGEGIAKIDGYTIFVKGAIKGEEVKILILKTLTSHAFAKITQIINKVEYRKEEDCKRFTRCGGCNLRHIEYNYTLDIKKSMVQNLVNKNLKQNVEVEDTVGMENPLFYRNKAIYPVRKGKRWKGNIWSIC